MARLAATLSVPRFGSCSAAFRAAAALVIFPWKLLADARLGTTPKKNVAAASPTTSVRWQRRLAELEVKQIESIVSALPSSRGLSFSLRTSPVNPMPDEVADAIPGSLGCLRALRGLVPPTRRALNRL